MKPKPFSIGALNIATPAILAPMAGFTDFPFRSLCMEQHCGLVFTEMTNTEGVIRNAPKTLHILETLPSERPVGAHIYGSNPAVMAEAAARIEQWGRFDLIDINAGCPIPKIMRRGDGAGLLRYPDRFSAVIGAVRKAVALPLTVKTRIGISPRECNIREIARCAEEAGANALFLHARFASVRHTGPADWEMLAQIKAERRIPVIGNGGVTKPADADEMLKKTGVDGVMVGRAAIGNPWLFQAIVRHWDGQDWAPPTLPERRAMIQAHLDRLIRLSILEFKLKSRPKYSIEASACRKFRCHLVRYLAGFPGLRGLTLHFEELESASQLMDLVDTVLNEGATAG